MAAFAISLRLGGFPNINALHSSHWQIFTGLMAFWGMVETARCLERRWTLYHVGRASASLHRFNDTGHGGGAFPVSLNRFRTMLLVIAVRA